MFIDTQQQFDELHARFVEEVNSFIDERKGDVESYFDIIEPPSRPQKLKYIRYFASKTFSHASVLASEHSMVKRRELLDGAREVERAYIMLRMWVELTQLDVEPELLDSWKEE